MLKIVLQFYLHTSPLLLVQMNKDSTTALPVFEKKDEEQGEWRKELYMPNASKSIIKKHAVIAVIQRDTGTLES